MYRIYGVLKCMSVFATLVALETFIRAAIFQAITIDDIWFQFARASRDIAFLTAVLGQTRLFPLVSKFILREKIFPDVDGQWEGIVESNWNIVGARCESSSASPNSQPVKVKVKIIATLFFIRMNLDSENDYSVSRTSFVNISKDPEDGSIRISYLYKNTTIRPSSTDCAEHDGAAILDFRVSDTKVKTLLGTYWTNRAWTKGLNTAGVITLKKLL